MFQITDDFLGFANPLTNYIVYASTSTSMMNYFPVYFKCMISHENILFFLLSARSPHFIIGYY